MAPDPVAGYSSLCGIPGTAGVVGEPGKAPCDPGEYPGRVVPGPKGLPGLLYSYPFWAEVTASSTAKEENERCYK